MDVDVRHAECLRLYKVLLFRSRDGGAVVSFCMHARLCWMSGIKECPGDSVTMVTIVTR